MESIPELRKICQTTAKKDVSNVYMRYVSRAASIYVTRWLIPTRVTADQVSFAMIVTGVIGGLVLLSPNTLMAFLGCLVLQLWYVLDCADGEVARYRDYEKRRQIVKDKIEMPVTGAYWDYLNHYIVHGFVPFACGMALFWQEGNVLWILAGFAASLGQTMLLAVHDTKSRAFLVKIKKFSEAGNAVAYRRETGGPSFNEKAKGWGIAKWVFVAVHYSTTYPTVMNVLTLCAVAALFCGFDLRGFFVVYYVIASWVVFLALAAKNLLHSGLDREFEFTFQTGKAGEDRS